MRYIIYVKGHKEEDDTAIKCANKEDMAEYAAECIKQGYKEVKAVVEHGYE